MLTQIKALAVCAAARVPEQWRGACGALARRGAPAVHYAYLRIYVCSHTAVYVCHHTNLAARLLAEMPLLSTTLTCIYMCVLMLLDEHIYVFSYCYYSI
jgi:hypothetical protein